MKKYIIIKSVIDSINTEFTCDNLFVVSNEIAKKYDITIDYMDVLSTVVKLYDDFEIDRCINEDGTITYLKNLEYYKNEDMSR